MSSPEPFGTEEKPWYLSVTIWSSLLIVIITVAKMAGYNLSALLDIQNELIILIITAATIYGRVKATTKVTK